jgi:hypothetical protein
MAVVLFTVQTKWTYLVTAPAGAKILDALPRPVHCCTISLNNGTVKVAPVHLATSTTLSNCLNGRCYNLKISSVTLRGDTNRKDML